MRKVTCVLALVVSILALGGVAPVAAQEEGGEGAQMKVSPVEIYGCMFREGKGRDDFAAAAAKFNAWMDATGQHDYFAYVAWPHYRSRDHEADLLWVGGWRSGEAMGASLGRYLEEGGEVAAGFAEVAECPYTANFAALFLSRPRDEGGPVRFSNCRVEEGHDVAEAMPAIRSWIDWEAAQGSEAEHFLLFPAYGESRDAEYDFKWVTASSWSELGEGWETYGNGGGWQKWGELFDGLLDCDTARLYVSTQVRDLGGEE